MPGAPDGVQRLLALIKALGPAGAQNTLMRLSDRELSIAMTHMEESERDRVFIHLSPAKGGRVREEISLQRQLRITVAQYRQVVEAVLAQLRTPGVPATRSYIRPMDAPNAADGRGGPGRRSPGVRRRPPSLAWLEATKAEAHPWAYRPRCGTDRVLVVPLRLASHQQQRTVLQIDVLGLPRATFDVKCEPAGGAQRYQGDWPAVSPRIVLIVVSANACVAVRVVGGQHAVEFAPRESAGAASLARAAMREGRLPRSWQEEPPERPPSCRAPDRRECSPPGSPSRTSSMRGWSPRC